MELISQVTIDDSVYLATDLIKLAQERISGGDGKGKIVAIEDYSKLSKKTENNINLLVANRDIYIDEELTVDYTKQLYLEQPMEDWI